MRGKVGAVVAIEPSTGEILMMVSSPTYDPDELVGRQRGNHYMEMLGNKRQPLYNRAVKARYPPGSTFKLVQGLIGMQGGGCCVRVTCIPCREGAIAWGALSMKCHSHPSPLDLRYAVSTSCNACFCYVFRDIPGRNPEVRRREGRGVRRVETLMSRASASAANSTRTSSARSNGYVPTTVRSTTAATAVPGTRSRCSRSLDRSGRAGGCTPLPDGQPWRPSWPITAAITTSPHRQARIGGVRLARPPLLRSTTRWSIRSTSNPSWRGMWRSVRMDGTSRRAMLPGLDVCGKTGTAQEPPRPRPLDVPVVCAARQSAHRHLGLCRERRLRRRGRAAHRQSDRGVLSHGHHPAARTAGGGEKHANLLSDL